jgi:hypothetical protein
MFGNLSEGTSQVMRSIREQFSDRTDDSNDGSKKPKASKAGRKNSAESKTAAKSKIDNASMKSRRSKMDKSHQSKRVLRSGMVRDGRGPQARG